jgi:hypothetical protein
MEQASHCFEVALFIKWHLLQAQPSVPGFGLLHLGQTSQLSLLAAPQEQLQLSRQAVHSGGPPHILQVFVKLMLLRYLSSE